MGISDNFTASTAERSGPLQPAKPAWQVAVGHLDELSPDALRELAELLVRDEYFERAQTVAVYALRHYPDALWAALLICTTAAALNNNSFRLMLAGSALQRWPHESNLALHASQAAVALGDKASAALFAEQLVKAESDSPHCYFAAADAWEFAGDFTKAVDCWKKGVDRFQNEASLHLRYVLCLLHLDRIDESRGLFSSKRSLLSSHPRFEEVEAALKAARPQRSSPATAQTPLEELSYHPAVVMRRERYGTYLFGRELFERALRSFEKARSLDMDNPLRFIGIARSYIHSGRCDEARVICERMLALEPTNFSLYLWLSAEVEMKAGNFEKAIRLTQQHMHDSSTGIHHISFLAHILRSKGEFESAWNLLDEHHSASHLTESERYKLEKIIQLVERDLGKVQHAMSRTARMQRRYSNRKFFPEMREEMIWYLWQQGLIAEAQDCYLSLKHNYQGTLKSKPLTPVTRRTFKRREKSNLILLFATVWNEYERIPSFLQHYRNLGVNEFYVVDNGSTDGTDEYLAEQQDVQLFTTDEPYSFSGFGLHWIHDLIDRYGKDHWCIHVDCDEFLVTPECERYGLLPLLQYMEKNQQYIFRAFMLDMYPARLRDCISWHGQQAPEEVCPYFDDTHVATAHHWAPFVDIRGGFRARILGDGSGPGDRLTKTPIIKGGRGIRYLSSTHELTPDSISDVTGALLHYNFIGDFKTKVSQNIERGEHHQNAMQYKLYNRWLANTPADQDLRTKDSVRFRSSEQLVELGLISTSHSFKSFCRPPSYRKLNQKEKVFVIGLSRTGTLSTIKALDTLGYEVAHWYHPEKMELIGGIQSLLEFDALGDIGISWQFEDLYHSFPDSKFIYTTREIHSWENSIRRHFERIHQVSSPQELEQLLFESPGPETNLDVWLHSEIAARALHSLYIPFQSWSAAYEAFESRVHSFIQAHDARRFLIIDVCSNSPEQEKWNALCSFLNLEAPEAATFPHQNQG